MYRSFDHLLSSKHRGNYLKYISIIYEIEIKSIAEIGVFLGKNTRILKKEFPDSHIYLIDPWKPDLNYLNSGNAVSKNNSTYEAAYLHVLSLFETDKNITILRKCSEDSIAFLPDNLDLIFIDANHEYHAIKHNISIFLPKIRSGGILAGHNFGQKKFPGVTKAVKEIFKDNFLLGQDKVWVHIKN